MTTAQDAYNLVGYLMPAFLMLVCWFFYTTLAARHD